jgi:hypothetical protein
MNIAVISYSLTGNNDALAKSIAGKLSAQHIRLTEAKNRKTGTIMADLLLGRTPKVRPAAPDIGSYDTVLLVGPVWIGQVATPLRAYLKRLKKEPCRYAFVSISGGADGPNPKLANELIKRTGHKTDALIDLHIADLLPAEPKPERKDTSAYKLSEDDVVKLTDTVVAKLGTFLGEASRS